VPAPTGPRRRPNRRGLRRAQAAFLFARPVTVLPGSNLRIAARLEPTLTASPEQYARASAGWLIYTSDGLVVSGPHVDEAEARVAGNAFAAELRASMERESYNVQQIAVNGTRILTP
jgi:hypothetical protein